MAKKICILDYGSGNVKSVVNLLRFLKIEHVVSNQAVEIEGATHLVLPGVGAFGAAMHKIRERIPIQAVTNSVFVDKKPFLGICVGMQVLADTGEEFGVHHGLGWIPGRVRRFQERGLPVPHMGWNEVRKRTSDLLLGDHAHLDFYFVHSYVFEPKEDEFVDATTWYGEEFPSIIRRGNILGVQFHPEKSQKAGMMLLSHFVGL